MRFEIKLALRYLTSSRLQTTLILAGVAVGIIGYTFIAALINGLAIRLTEDVIGNLAHITLEPAERPPRLVIEPEALPLVAVQRGEERRPEIFGWRAVLEQVRDTPEVTAAVAEAVGSGMIRRGEKVMPVTFIGTEDGAIREIVRLGDSLARGRADAGPGDVVVGVLLADELGLTTGQRLLLSSERDRDQTLTIRGLFDVGSSSLNERVVYVDLATAQSLLELEGAISRIEVKVQDVSRAPTVARRLARLTGLEAKDWIAENQRLRDALEAQSSTGRLIKVFSMLTIVIGVTSVLLLSAVRRRAEIGILRSFGVKRRSVAAIFLLQGAFIGALGSGAGAGLGYLFCRLLEDLTRRPDGTLGLPVAPGQGEYASAILLATLASSLAAILPARRASLTDPVEVIQQ